MGLSKSLQTRLTELEKEHEELAGKLSEVEPHSMKIQLRDARRFVEARLRKLHSLFNGDPRLVRAEIAKHVQRITLAPDGRTRTYVASGTWNLLGSVAVTMVPGARHGPKVYLFVSSGCLLLSVEIWKSLRAGANIALIRPSGWFLR